MTDEELDQIRRRCYAPDDPRITEPERYVHQLLEEIHRLRPERDEGREVAREYLDALLALSALTSSDGCENIRSEFLEEERKKHPWLRGKV